MLVWERLALYGLDDDLAGGGGSAVSIRAVVANGFRLFHDGSERVTGRFTGACYSQPSSAGGRLAGPLCRFDCAGSTLVSPPSPPTAARSD